MIREGLTKRTSHEDRQVLGQSDRGFVSMGVSELDPDEKKKVAGDRMFQRYQQAPSLHAEEDDNQSFSSDRGRQSVNHQTFLFFVTVASFVSRFLYIDYPDEVVFDEVHFGGFTNQYMTGSFYFDIHPPLAKLMLGFVGYMIGYDGHFSFEHITNRYDGDFYIYLRCLPAFFGSLIPPLAFLTMKEYGASDFAALTGGLMVIFDTCILLESRLILTDAVLMFFVSLSIYCYSRVANTSFLSRDWFLWLAATGFSLGGCISVKWTALATMALVGLETLITLLNNFWTQTNRERLIDWGTKGVLLFIVPISIYVLAWVIHIHFLPKTGPGAIFTSERFRKRLIGNNEDDDISPISILAAIYEFQGQIYIYNQGIISPHAWMSSWWTWPFMIKGIAYWSKQEGRYRRHIYLMGNPIIWWVTSFFTMLFVLSVLFIPFRNEITQSERKMIPRGLYLIFGYIINIVPYIGVGRVTFLYHYMPALYVAILLTNLFLDTHLRTIFTSPSEDSVWYSKNLRWPFIVLICAFVACFFHFSPLLYGSPLSESEREALKWLPSWD